MKNTIIIIILGLILRINLLASFTLDRDPPEWEFDYHEYEHSGFIWGIVYLDGEIIQHNEGMIGCFVMEGGNEVCRGIAQQSDNSVHNYMDTFGHFAYMPMVYSDVTLIIFA